MKLGVRLVLSVSAILGLSYAHSAHAAVWYTCRGDCFFGDDSKISEISDTLGTVTTATQALDSLVKRCAANGDNSSVSDILCHAKDRLGNSTPYCKGWDLAEAYERCADF